MPRGGYRPGKGTSAGPSGPGKFSQRTDTPKVPGLSSPDMQYGDVGRLADAQKIAPIPGGSHPRPSGRSGRPAPLPPAFFERPSSSPAEPFTHGMDMGPGGGSEVLSSPPAPPDVREQVLQFLSVGFQNPDAAAMLQQLRQSRLQAQAPTIPGLLDTAEPAASQPSPPIQ